MADKRIQDLPNASSVGLADYFVLEQSGAAMSLSGQVLVNDLATALDGHGGIDSISYTPPVSPSLDGTLTITLADETEISLSVTNGRGITSISWVDSGTPGDGATHTGTISYNDGTTSTVAFQDGEKGEQGDQTYVWFKWADDEPTSDGDMSDTASAWIGVYSGTSSTAPAHYTDYVWYEYKGDKGDTGANVASIAWTGNSGGSAQGSPGTTDTYTVYLDDGSPAGSFSVYNGLNGEGAVSTVNGIVPDENGDVQTILSSVADLGLTEGSATFSDAYSALAANQTLVCPASHFASSEMPYVNGAYVTDGTVEVFKGSFYSSGWVKLHGRVEYVKPVVNGGPIANIWENVIESIPLFDNSSGATSASLARNISNYNRLKITWGPSDRSYILTQEIYTHKDSQVAVPLSYSTEATQGGNVTMGVLLVSLNGTNLSTSRNYLVTIGSSVTSAAGTHRIFYVEGYYN